jgi:hypothetical protein
VVIFTAWRFERNMEDDEELEALACKEGLLPSAEWWQQERVRVIIESLKLTAVL